MRINNSSRSRDKLLLGALFSNPKAVATASAAGLLILLASSTIIGGEFRQMHSEQNLRSWNRIMIAGDDNNIGSQGLDDPKREEETAAARVPSSKNQSLPRTTTTETLRVHAWKNQSRQGIIYDANPFALAPGELPGYTGWARPEQTLAGYFDIAFLSRPTANTNALSHTTKSGDIFTLLLTCNHNRTNGRNGAEEAAGSEDYDPPYECPSAGGALFYVRAYGPSVITGIVTDFHNSSYSVEIQFIDPGEYTLEVVLTFSIPLEFREFPLADDDSNTAVEPGYEGYMVSGFPLSIIVEPSSTASSADDLEGRRRKPWCTVSQLTDSSPVSALYKGHWRVIDHVARVSHQPVTSDETDVSMDGYRMGLNSVGVRMTYDYEECELIHIRDLIGAIHGGMDKCLETKLGLKFHAGGEDDRFAGMHGSYSNARYIDGTNLTINETRHRLAGLRGDISDSRRSYNSKGTANGTRGEIPGLGGNKTDIGDNNVTIRTFNDTRVGLAGPGEDNSDTTSDINATSATENGTRGSLAEMRANHSGAGYIPATENNGLIIQQDTIEDDNFEGIHVIFIGDSVMKLVMSFFFKLVERTSIIKVTFIETNGGIHVTLNNVTSVLKEIQQREESQTVKRAIIFNSGLHDIDVLCSSRRSHSRRKHNIMMRDGESCENVYRAGMTALINFLDEYPAELKVFRSTTAGEDQKKNISTRCFQIMAILISN